MNNLFKVIVFQSILLNGALLSAAENRTINSCKTYLDSIKSLTLLQNTFKNGDGPLKSLGGLRQASDKAMGNLIVYKSIKSLGEKSKEKLNAYLLEPIKNKQDKLSGTYQEFIKTQSNKFLLLQLLIDINSFDKDNDNNIIIDCTKEHSNIDFCKQLTSTYPNMRAALRNDLSTFANHYILSKTNLPEVTQALNSLISLDKKMTTADTLARLQTGDAMSKKERWKIIARDLGCEGNAINIGTPEYLECLLKKENDASLSKKINQAQENLNNYGKLISAFESNTKYNHIQDIKDYLQAMIFHGCDPSKRPTQIHCNLKLEGGTNDLDLLIDQTGKVMQTMDSPDRNNKKYYYENFSKIQRRANDACGALFFDNKPIIKSTMIQTSICPHIKRRLKLLADRADSKLAGATEFERKRYKSTVYNGRTQSRVYSKRANKFDWSGVGVHALGQGLGVASTAMSIPSHRYYTGLENHLIGVKQYQYEMNAYNTWMMQSYPYGSFNYGGNFSTPYSFNQYGPTGGLGFTIPSTAGAYYGF